MKYKLIYNYNMLSNLFKSTFEKIILNSIDILQFSLFKF